MNTAIVIAIGVIVAAMIGGVTNYLAIRMLFRPRKTLYIGSWRVPFTPGLIPKRRDEIASSLGRVVAEYLVTSDALKELLESRTFAERLANDRIHAFHQWLTEKEGVTVREWLEEWIPGGLSEERLADWSGRMDGWFREVFAGFWTGSALADKPFRDLLPGWTSEKRNMWAERLARYAADALAKEAASPDGERLILQLTKQLIDQAGGFFGAMAAIFMDEYKVAAKVRSALLEALKGERVQDAMARFFDRQMEKAEGKSLRELLALAGLPADDGEALAEKLGGLMPWEDWLAKAAEAKPVSLLSGYADKLEAALPKLAELLLKAASRHADRLFGAIRLDEIVERQVRDFPIERLEDIILDISGREFRAITWLGALLGGLIGLFQSILLRLLS